MENAGRSHTAARRMHLSCAPSRREDIGICRLLRRLLILACRLHEFAGDARRPAHPMAQTIRWRLRRSRLPQDTSHEIVKRFIVSPPPCLPSLTGFGLPPWRRFGCNTGDRSRAVVAESVAVLALVYLMMPRRSLTRSNAASRRVMASRASRRFWSRAQGFSWDDSAHTLRPRYADAWNTPSQE